MLPFNSRPFFCFLIAFLSFLHPRWIPRTSSHSQHFFMNVVVIFIFIFMATLATQTVSVDPKFKACAPQNCGNGPDISYPFWIYGEQESYCGYPNFGITCNDKNPELNISNDDYIIKEIFYANNSLLVVNSAAYEDKCPTPPHNLTLARTPFSRSLDNRDLLLLFNCTKKPPEYIKYPISCATNDTHYSFAVVHGYWLPNESYPIESCQSSVHALVDFESGGIGADLLKMNYTAILKMGFFLNWTAPNCNGCEASGGRCGFDNNEFVCFCKDKPHHKTCDDAHKRKIGLKVGIGISAGLIAMTITCILLCICRSKKISSVPSTCLFRKSSSNDHDLEAFIRNYGPLAPKRYSFSDVRKMTNSFKDNLGQGGYGDVYKGKLSDGHLVAVKLLKKSKGNGQEFINEVASISRTSHINVVTLLGFCLEGSKRALIYELMPNGSLEKFIHNKDTSTINQHLGWEKLYQIAVGIAKGLEYLHCWCNTRILHFDIKPHNILLDEDFCPKISDFGLAKLCLKNESIVSMLEARGTIGYIAPEVFSRNFGQVSHKSDVYSYGMMVLEMVGGKKNLAVEVVNTSEIYFPHWICRQFQQGNEFRWHGVNNKEENEIAQKMIIVGLWCIQTHPSDRPSINKVINMLQGSIEALEVPPKPFLSSSPPRLPIDYSTTSLSST